MAEAARAAGLTTYEEPDVRQALALARRLVDASGLVVVAGSLYIVGTARADVLEHAAHDLRYAGQHEDVADLEARRPLDRVLH